ncbi:hypothetical protein ACJW31_09G127300 [Castanea mollissima]
MAPIISQVTSLCVWLLLILNLPTLPVLPLWTPTYTHPLRRNLHSYISSNWTKNYIWYPAYMPSLRRTPQHVCEKRHTPNGHIIPNLCMYHVEIFQFLYNRNVFPYNFLLLSQLYSSLPRRSNNNKIW